MWLDFGYTFNVYKSCCVWFMYIIISCLYSVIKLGCEQLIHGKVDHIFFYHVMWFLLVFISLCISCALLTTDYNGLYTWSWREEYSRYELFCNFTFHVFTVDTIWSPILYNNRGTNSSIIHKPWKPFFFFFLVKSRFEWKKTTPRNSMKIWWKISQYCLQVHSNY